MEYRYTVFISISIILFVLFSSGCITIPPTNPREPRVDSIGTGESLTLSRDEVLQLNYSQLALQSQQIGYTPKNNSEGNITVYIFTKMENNTRSPTLRIDVFSSNTISKITGDYDPEYSFPESNLTEKKQYLKDRVNEIATICNLTVNWSQVQWTVNYAD